MTGDGSPEATAATSRSQTRVDAVQRAYDGSSTVYRLLALSGWGPALLNLGYYGPVPLLGGIAAAQRRLVRKAVGLLGVNADDRILDVACGRGESSSILKQMHPASTVTGVDLLDENIAFALAHFSAPSGLSFQTGDAMSLAAPDGSFDRVICIEAAFHFPDRARFLRESFRVLRPGGRLVVVDFTWTTPAARQERDDPRTQLVRRIWQWDDFSAASEYAHDAAAAGFVSRSAADWSARVTRQLQRRFALAVTMGSARLGRGVLRVAYPRYREFSPADWHDLALAVEAHAHVQRHSRYMAFVFDKV